MKPYCCLIYFAFTITGIAQSSGDTCPSRPLPCSQVQLLQLNESSSFLCDIYSPLQDTYGSTAIPLLRNLYHSRYLPNWFAAIHSFFVCHSLPLHPFHTSPITLEKIQRDVLYECGIAHHPSYFCLAQQHEYREFLSF